MILWLNSSGNLQHSYPHTYTQIHAEITVPNFLLLKISLISRSIIAPSLLMLEKIKIKIPVTLFKIRWPKTAQLYVCSSVHACAYTCTHTCVLAVHFSLEGNCKQVALSTELTPFSLMIFKYFSSEFKPLHILHLVKASATLQYRCQVCSTIPWQLPWSQQLSTTAAVRCSDVPSSVSATDKQNTGKANSYTAYSWCTRD